MQGEAEASSFIRTIRSYSFGISSPVRGLALAIPATISR